MSECLLFTLLIDTCVWLDLAKDHQQQLGALEELKRNGRVLLVLPRTVLEEFARNKTRISVVFPRRPHAADRSRRHGRPDDTRPRRRTSRGDQGRDLRRGCGGAGG